MYKISLLTLLFAVFIPFQGHANTFPTPTCLKNNVVFWESVYRDLGENEAYLHDRWHLDRVVAKVSLPKNRRLRKKVKRQILKSYEKLLMGISSKIKNKQLLSQREIKFLVLFPKGRASAKDVAKTAQSLRLQTGLKRRFEKGVKRSLRYLPLIQAVLQKNKIPVELAFLPHVESSYHPFAKSHSGAVGMWQIMPGTMKMLMGKRAIKKRTHVGTATLAASKLLNINFKKARKWPLAITAYNHGLRGVMNGVKKTGSRDICKIIANYKSRTFGFASRNFYAQFLAAINVAYPKYQGLAKNGMNEWKVS